VLQRAATISYAVYGSHQEGLTAEQIRAEAALGAAGPSEKAGTRNVGSGSVGDPVTLVVDSLASGAEHWIYFAADPAQEDPVPTDLETTYSEYVDLLPVQPAVSYTSTAIAATTIGYYSFLPEDHYFEADESFPLVIFLHGSGEKGNGTTEVSRVLVHGPPKLVKNGRRFPFILISPQLPASQGGWPVGLVDELIARAKVAYRVDTTRIYVTGLSLGAFGTWAYATSRPNVVAAVVPIAGAGSTGQACSMKNIPTWAFHGDADGTVNYSGSVNMVNAIKACSPAGSPEPKLTIYPGVGHDSWSRTYDGSAGHDIYEWMLQYHK
jgi:predicted peptidase